MLEKYHNCMTSKMMSRYEIMIAEIEQKKGAYLTQYRKQGVLESKPGDRSQQMRLLWFFEVRRTVKIA